MKNRLFEYLLTLTVLIGGMYVMSHLGVTYKSHHPALNEAAEEPEIYLGNVRHYLKERMVNRSLYHLENAINSIRNVEVDFDTESQQQVEGAITRLTKIYHEILSDSLITDDMNEAFEYTLNALAVAELRVSERYAESNNSDLARVALKYACLHLKNAAEYGSLSHQEYERHVYAEIDSLIQSESLPPEVILAKIDHLILEMDHLVAGN